MSIKLIPESAPFNDEQKAWLNGFLAGMMGMDPSESATSAATALLEEPVAAVEEEEDFPWHDPGMPIDERMQLAEGKPVERKLMAAMAQLNCGACGYLCQTYSEAIASGEETNLKLCVPGAKETSRMLKKVLTEADDVPEQFSSRIASPASSNGFAFTRQNPFPARLIKSETLNKPGSAKDVRHVEIDLTGSHLKYKVGDALGVFPTNCEELIGQVIAEFPEEAESAVSLHNQSMTFAEALRSHCCLKDVSDDLVGIMIEQAETVDKNKLIELLDSDELDDMDVLDLLHDFPHVRPPAISFVNALTSLAPRLYSIASSRSAVGEAVHLTIGKVLSEARNRPRKGVASTMFAERLAPGEELKVFLQPSHGFGVPTDDQTPLIMIGPGTGIAPFRAFLQERAARHNSGKNWLFFGDQKSDTDFLYEAELMDYLNSGVLNRLDTAFSRDQVEKIYVQNRMLEQAAEFYQWLEEGAWVTVCGDARRMAVDVDKALHQIIEQAGGKSVEEAKQYVKELTAQGRYLRDVY